MIIFWIIITVLLLSSALAFGLTFMVIGVDVKSSKNRFFALFMITVAMWSLTNIIMRLMLFYESGPIDVVYRLVSISYVLICPSLLLFTVRYLNKKTLLVDIFYLGLLTLIGAALFLSDGSSIHEAPVLTDGYNISYSFSAVGYILTSIYIAPGIISLILFYKDKQTGDISRPFMVGGTLFVLIGYIIGGFQVIQIPASPFTFIISLVIFGYMVLRLQVFNPLRENEEKQRAILNATTESIILIDLDGKILTLNNTAAKRLGKSPDELIGKDIAEYLSSDMAKERRSLVDGLIRSRKPIRFQDEHDGILLDSNLYPVFDKNKKIYAIAIYSNDITNLEKAREERNIKAKELDMFGDLSIDRELRMVQLKNEVNELLEKLGEERRYETVEISEGGGSEE
ncbi:MAG: PAS domain S-box protein [Thermoplasmata archaeon]|nr:PAS domain S-box protein [Thermoplasmata archaeon]